MKTSESRLKAAAKYNREKTTCVNIRLSINTDSDIIEHLRSMPSKMGYIKRLIREDIQKG